AGLPPGHPPFGANLILSRSCFRSCSARKARYKAKMKILSTALSAGSGDEMMNRPSLARFALGLASAALFAGAGPALAQDGEDELLPANEKVNQLIVYGDDP